MSPDLSVLSLVQLRCFLAVIDQKSFAKAGRQLGMTTSGVSKTIARMETACGLRLLHRSTHSISVTEAGEKMIGPARTVVTTMRAAEASLKDDAGLSGVGRVRLSAPVAFVRTCLVPMLPMLFAARPDIVLDIRASDATADLAEEGIDLALRSGSLDGLPGHVRLPWFSFPWVACAAPAYLARAGMPHAADELRAHALIGFRNVRTGLVEPWRLRDNHTPGLTPAAWRVVLDDAEAAWLAALNGIGIAWAPYWLAADALKTGAAIEVLRNWRDLSTPMSIIHRGSLSSQDRVRAVIDFLTERGTTFQETGPPSYCEQTAGSGNKN